MEQGFRVITGASSGIGAALAMAYARSGESLLLMGRDAARLAEVATACRERGAAVETGLLDMTDTASCQAWCTQYLPNIRVKQWIACAGVSSGVQPDGHMESVADALRVVDVNLSGVMRLAVPVLEHMAAQGAGQVVFISSLAGVRGLPHSPAYSASKAGVIAYADALRGWYGAQGVDVRLVCPGYVTSPMSARVLGVKYGEMTAEAAAMRMVKALAQRQAVIVFPKHLWWGMRALGCLPRRMGDAILRRWFGFTVLPEEVVQSTGTPSSVRSSAPFMGKRV